MRKEDRERQDMVVRGLTEMMTFEAGLKRSEDIAHETIWAKKVSERQTTKAEVVRCKLPGAREEQQSSQWNPNE